MNIGLPDASNPTPATPDPTHTCIAHNYRVSKTKMEPYADSRRHTQVSSLQSGDHVLVRRRKLNKLTPPFNSQPYTVVRKQGSMVTAQRGKKLVTRNSSRIKGDILTDDEGEEEEKVQPHPLPPVKEPQLLSRPLEPALSRSASPALLRSPRPSTPPRLRLSPPEAAPLSHFDEPCLEENEK